MELRPRKLRSATLADVSETRELRSFDVECPHCHKSFSGPAIEGAAARYRGFKCPHCKLFVPESRAEDAPLSRDRAG